MSLHELAASVLGVELDEQGLAKQSFIDLGGDSLRAMRLAALTRDRLGLDLPVRALLGGEPLAAVFAQARPAERTPVAEPAPSVLNGLSHSQRGMWLIESVTGGSPYNLVFTAFVERGLLDFTLLRTAVTETVARHEGLRTVFTDNGGGVERVVLAEHTPEFRCFLHDGADFTGYVRETTAEQGRQPFDLTVVPALRLLHFAHADGRQAVALIVHHMVLDGMSIGLVWREILARYAALATGTPVEFGPGVPLGALIRHQERQRASGLWDRQAAFWAEHLATVPTVLELPADRQRPAVQDAAGARAPFQLAADTSALVADRARELGITTFALLLGAFALTLSRTTGARRLLVGVPLIGRDSAELAEIIAVAGNLVPVRIDVDDTVTVAEYLRSVHDSLTASMAAGQLPFEELVARLGIERTVGAHPLVQVCFGMHDQLVPQRLHTGPLDVRIEEGHGGGAQFDLTLLLGQAEPHLAGHLEYATSVWQPAELAGFADDLRTATAELAGGPDLPLDAVRCLSTGRRAELAAINEVRTEFPDTSLDALFRAVAARRPGAVAVRERSTELSYRRLAEAAAEQARLLRGAGVNPGDRVLVGVPRSIAEVVAVLGILTAGASYVGIDQDLPAAQMRQIVATADPAAIVAEPGTVHNEGLRGIPVVPAWHRVWSGEFTDLSAADPARPAYVAFTSGSTGAPKGVQVPHRAVLRLVHEAEYLRIGQDDVVLRLAPLAFDASTLELWGALLTGATLEVYPAEALPAPTELGKFLLGRRVTVAWLTAGLFRLVEEFAPDGLGGLTHLLTGGDVVPHDHVARALSRHPGLVITNGYGPTENTTFTTTYSVHRADEVDGPLPIGTPVPGTTVYVLDEHGRQVPPGAVGELYTGGAGLADGYLGDPAETARRFGPFRAEVPERLYRTGDIVRLDTRGRLAYLGRSDDQVKLRGYRIELSAISDALKADPGVKDAVVVVTGGHSAEKRLVAGVVLAPDATVGTGALRERLASALPAYMVPTLWTVVDSIPLTQNGKVDRDALAATARPASAAPAASDDLDRIMALFAEAIEPAGAEIRPDTDFFVSGGNSLGAVALLRLLKKHLSVTVRLREFLLAPTPAGVRQLVARSKGATGHAG